MTQKSQKYLRENNRYIKMLECAGRNITSPEKIDVKRV